MLIQRRGYELEAILQVMHQMRSESLVDGFEFQNLGEWDSTNPPRDKAQFEVRIKNWEICEKYSIDELGEALNQSELPILSVHSNRDVGICLCSDKQQENKRGQQLVYDSLNLSQQVGAKICVFHLWDTWKKKFNPDKLRKEFQVISDEYPTIKATVENIPINLENTTPFDIVKQFDWITLDLRWAGMYNELNKFELIKDKILNIHLRGRLEENQWVIHHAPFSFYDAINQIRKEWKYQGLLTLEPEGGLKNSSWQNFTEAMKSLREHTT